MISWSCYYTFTLILFLFYNWIPSPDDDNLPFLFDIRPLITVGIEGVNLSLFSHCLIWVFICFGRLCCTANSLNESVGRFFSIALYFSGSIKLPFWFLIMPIDSHSVKHVWSIIKSRYVAKCCQCNIAISCYTCLVSWKCYSFPISIGWIPY